MRKDLVLFRLYDPVYGTFVHTLSLMDNALKYLDCVSLESLLVIPYFQTKGIKLATDV